MLYARFETKKNIIFIFSLEDWSKKETFFTDLYSTIIQKLCDFKLDKSIEFVEIGETHKFTCIKYSPTFNRFYTIIRKVNI